MMTPVRSALLWCSGSSLFIPTLKWSAPFVHFEISIHVPEIKFVLIRAISCHAA
jgi:hypothetical protein